MSAPLSQTQRSIFRYLSVSGKISLFLPCLPAPVPTEGGAGRLYKREEFLLFSGEYVQSTTSVVNQKFLYFVCHSGLDPESSLFELDSCWSLPRTRYGAGMTVIGSNVKKC
jgi:hypothetical protein